MKPNFLKYKVEIWVNKTGKGLALVELLVRNFILIGLLNYSYLFIHSLYTSKYYNGTLMGDKVHRKD